MLTKREVMKCEPGTILQLSWTDNEPTVGLLLEKPTNEKGDVSLFVYHFDTSQCDRHTIHSQVMCVLGALSSSDYMD